VPVNGRSEACHCGHDKATHHRDLATATVVACLARGCDCPAYVHQDAPKPVRLRPRPNHANHCRCYECRKHIGSAA